MKYIEYVDLASRSKSNPLPAFDLQNRPKFKKETKFWLGYTEKNAKAKVLDPEWIETAIVTDECEK